MRVAKHNINSYIWVKLTDIGYKIYYDYQKEFAESLSFYGYKLSLTSRALEVDDEGWCKFQMWNFMEIFGSHISVGSGGPIETSIKIQVED